MKKIITLIALITSIIGFSQTKIENVDATTFKKLIDEKKSYLIDLRTDDELKNKGFIKVDITLTPYCSMLKDRRPSWAMISSVCSPKPGAGLRISPGVRENFTGTPAIRIFPSVG